MCERFAVGLFHVYIVEAHPADGWVDADNVNEGVCHRQPTDLGERVALAKIMVAELKLDPTRVLVDSMDNAAEAAFEARPEKLAVVRDGSLAFLSGIGPYQYSPAKLAAWLGAEFGA